MADGNDELRAAIEGRLNRIEADIRDAEETISGARARIDALEAEAEGFIAAISANPQGGSFQVPDRFAKLHAEFASGIKSRGAADSAGGERGGAGASARIPTGVTDRSGWDADAARPSADVVGGKSPRVRHTDMVKWCSEILEEHGGGPMDVADILRELRRGEERGYVVPGQGITANVSVHLGRAKEVFEPVGRGVWKLRASGGGGEHA